MLETALFKCVPVGATQQQRCGRHTLSALHSAAQKVGFSVPWLKVSRKARSLYVAEMFYTPGIILL